MHTILVASEHLGHSGTLWLVPYAEPCGWSCGWPWLLSGIGAGVALSLAAALVLLFTCTPAPEDHSNADRSSW